MYFIPQRDAWYRPFAHIKPIYRYGMTSMIVLVISFSWLYGLEPWLNGMVARDYAQLAHLNAQIVQLSQAERTCTGLSCSLEQLRTKVAGQAQRCSGEFCQNQLTTLIDEAQKAGVQLTSYGSEKEIKKSWCTCREVQVGLSGSLDTVVKFLNNIKQSHAMIQCNQLSCTRANDASFNASCTMRFVSL